MRHYQRQEAIRQLIPDFSGPQISELLDIPVDTIRDICKASGIHMPRGPRGKHRDEDPGEIETPLPEGRYRVLTDRVLPAVVIDGEPPSGRAGRWARVIGRSGPVRILMQNGKRL